MATGIHRKDAKQVLSELLSHSPSLSSEEAYKRVCEQGLETTLDEITQLMKEKNQDEQAAKANPWLTFKQQRVVNGGGDAANVGGAQEGGLLRPGAYVSGDLTAARGTVWKPIEITNIKAAKRAGLGCQADTLELPPHIQRAIAMPSSSLANDKNDYDVDWSA